MLKYLCFSFYCVFDIGSHDVPAHVESKSGNSSFDDGQGPEEDMTIIRDLLSKIESPNVCSFVIEFS
jgi:hypothetical protein